MIYVGDLESDQIWTQWLGGFGSCAISGLPKELGPEVGHMGVQQSLHHPVLDQGSGELPGWNTPMHLVTHHSWEGNTIYNSIRRGQNTGSWNPRCLKLAWGLSRVPLPYTDFNPYTLTVIYHNHELSVRFETPSGKVSNQQVILETPAFVTGIGSDSVLVAWSLQLGRDPTPIFCSFQTQGFYLLGYFRAQEVCWYPRNYIIVEDWKDHKGIIVSSCPSKLK